MNRRSSAVRRGHRRIPAFLPVPLRALADGWSPPRQAAFLAALALTRSVRAAAVRVGMSRESAYRLRRRAVAASFAAAWDAVLGKARACARKVTPDTLVTRPTSVLLKPLLYAGRHVATLEKADNSALLRLLAQLGRHEREAPAGQSDTCGFAPHPASTRRQSERGSAEFSQHRYRRGEGSVEQPRCRSV